MTQTRKEALIELRDKVWTGGISVIGPSSFSALNGGRGVYADHQASDAMRAYNGSLDAAKALHEAVLPGWDVSLNTSWGKILNSSVSRHGSGSFYAKHDPMGKDLVFPLSRVWLLAILEALIAEAGGGE
jgi:hypothetical protein